MAACDQHSGSGSTGAGSTICTASAIAGGNNTGWWQLHGLMAAALAQGSNTGSNTGAGNNIGVGST
jgi:hypothetical protein